MANMEQSDLAPLLDRLGDNVDELHDVLGPLLKTNLPETAAKLPLLDKAKLCVLVTYAIESILFSYLRLADVDAKNHPVYRELTRVRQYFEKITATETGTTGQKRENLGLDKKAAARFITSALAGNDRLDLARAEQQASDKARAHIRFDQLGKKRKADDAEEEGERDDASSPSDEESADLSAEKTEEDREPSGDRLRKERSAVRERAEAEGTSKTKQAPSKKERKLEKRIKKRRSRKEREAAEREKNKERETAAGT